MRCGRSETYAFRSVLLGVLACLVSAPVVAAPTAEQNQKLHAADAALTKAETSYKEGKIRDAVASFKQAQDALVEAAAVPEMAQRVQPIKRRLVNLHDMMELDGARVPAVAAALTSAATTPDVATTKPAKTPPVANDDNPGKDHSREDNAGQNAAQETARRQPPAALVSSATWLPFWLPSAASATSIRTRECSAWPAIRP